MTVNFSCKSTFNVRTDETRTQANTQIQRMLEKSLCRAGGPLYCTLHQKTGGGGGVKQKKQTALFCVSRICEKMLIELRLWIAIVVHLHSNGNAL